VIVAAPVVVPVAGLVVAGVVFAGVVFFGGVFAGGLEELPQPATSAALAAATTRDEYSLRVMVPPWRSSDSARGRSRLGI
jgi:hypothetical protein